METLIPLFLILLGAALGAGAAVLLIKGKYASTASLLTDRVDELSREVALRETRLQETEKQLNTEKQQRAALKAEIKRIPALEKDSEELRVESRLRAAAESEVRRIPILEQTMRQAEIRIREEVEANANLRSENSELRMELEKDRVATREKIALLQDAKKKLSDTFASVGQQALQQSNQSFLELAKESFKSHQEIAKGELEKRQQAISEIVRPMGESLDKFNERVREIELKRENSYTLLTEQLRVLADGQILLRSETTNLVHALRSPTGRGRWGEIQLRRVVEMAGMLNHCDFDEQVSEDTEDGKQRPDMIIRLPGGKNVIVDAKVPLAASLDAFKSDDENFRREKMRDHARHVRAHITMLSKKSYWEQFKPTPEFVVLFLPGEAFLYAALEQDPSLIEDGITDKVILATPTTLIAMLKAISYGWRQENIEQNAREISDLGAELYKRLATVGEHFSRLGSNLDKAVRSYNDSVGSLERNVLTTARKLKDHGISTGAKEIEDLNQVETATRLVERSELKELMEPSTNGEAGSLFTE